MAPVAVTENAADASIDEKKEQMNTLFLEGKRAYIIGDLASAAEKFGEASELSVEVFGEFAAEAFEPHYYYGKTMLEMASVEDRVFSNAMQNTTKEGEEDDDKEDEPADEQVGNPNELTENEQEEIAEKVADALEENAAELDKAHNAPDATESEDKDEQTSPKKEDEPAGEGENAKATNGSDEADGKEGESDEKGEETPMEEDGNKDESAADEETAGGNENSQEEELESMQLAWEALEVARAICDKHSEADGFKEKKADVLLELIECSIQNANYKQAMDDVEVCIEVCKGLGDINDQRLDAAYFHKARAFALDKQFDNAAQTYKTVKQHIQRRLERMEKEAADETDTEKKEKAQEEVQSLKELVDDIQNKVDDALESAKNTAQVEKEQAENTSKMGELKATMPGEASDITGLVRKKGVKRPAEEQDVPGTDEKKPKEDKESTEQQPAAVAQ